MSESLDLRGLPEGYPFKPEYEVTPRDAAAALREGGLLIDCRTQQEWETARVEGAVLIPLAELGERLEELTEHQDRPVHIICHSGGRSLRAALFLKQAGFDEARSVAGGIDLWARDVDRSVPRYVKGPAGCRVVSGNQSDG